MSANKSDAIYKLPPIPLSAELREALQADAKRCCRTPKNQALAVLEAYYSLNTSDLFIGAIDALLEVYDREDLAAAPKKAKQPRKTANVIHYPFGEKAKASNE